METYSSVDEVQEAIGEVLASCVNDIFSKKTKSPVDEIEIICSKLYSVLKPDGDNGDDLDDKEELLQPVHLGTMANGFDVKEEAWKSIWTSGKEMGSKVNAKKLQKAEDKLKQKANRRDNAPIVEVVHAAPQEATVSQAVSKKTAKLEISGVNKTKDIKVENFDISFGSNLLLSGAELNLSKFFDLLVSQSFYNIFFVSRLRSAVWSCWKEWYWQIYLVEDDFKWFIGDSFAY